MKRLLTAIAIIHCASVSHTVIAQVHTASIYAPRWKVMPDQGRMTAFAMRVDLPFFLDPAAVPEVDLSVLPELPSAPGVAVDNALGTRASLSVGASWDEEAFVGASVGAGSAKGGYYQAAIRGGYSWDDWYVTAHGRYDSAESSGSISFPDFESGHRARFEAGGHTTRGRLSAGRIIGNVALGLAAETTDQRERLRPPFWHAFGASYWPRYETRADLAGVAIRATSTSMEGGTPMRIGVSHSGSLEVYAVRIGGYNIVERLPLMDDWERVETPWRQEEWWGIQRPGNAQCVLRGRYLAASSWGTLSIATQWADGDLPRTVHLDAAESSPLFEFGSVSAERGVAASLEHIAEVSRTSALVLRLTGTHLRPEIDCYKREASPTLTVVDGYVGLRGRAAGLSIDVGYAIRLANRVRDFQQDARAFAEVPANRLSFSVRYGF